MELKIYNPQDSGFLQKIEWNFEELKKEIAAASYEYEASVYTDDTIKAAKADRAKLNKFVDALNGKRTEIRKALLKPDEQFSQEIKELTGIVQKAISNIDSQVKSYEQRLREEKISKVQEFYEENINDLAPVLPFDRVFKSEYANASTTMKSIKEDILSLIQRVGEGLAIINEVDSKYAGDMKEVFLRTYDIGAAMAERNRLEVAEEKRKAYEEELSRKKTEREANVQKETSRVIQAGNVIAPIEEPKKEPSTCQNIPTLETVEDPLHILEFRVHATKVQLDKLKEFLITNKIQFGPVPKGDQ